MRDIEKIENTEKIDTGRQIEMYIKNIDTGRQIEIQRRYSNRQIEIDADTDRQIDRDTETIDIGRYIQKRKIQTEIGKCFNEIKKNVVEI